jgi:anti-anti-sigma factor
MLTPEPFGFRYETEADRTLVFLVGELDAGSVEGFRRFVEETPFESDTVVDLTGLTLIDSEGLGCLFRLQQRVADAGGLLIGRGASPGIRRTFEIVQLNQVMALVDDR